MVKKFELIKNVASTFHNFICAKNVVNNDQETGGVLDVLLARRAKWIIIFHSAIHSEFEINFAFHPFAIDNLNTNQPSTSVNSNNLPFSVKQLTFWQNLKLITN